MPDASRRRSTSAGRCRRTGVRAARARRQLAVDAARARRHRPHYVKDILEAVGRGEGPSRILVTLGYAGWSPGQLEHELAQNAWLTVEARDAIIFDVPSEERLPAAMELLGLDYARLQDAAGHA